MNTRVLSAVLFGGLVVATGVALYEINQADHTQAELQKLNARQGSVAEQIRDLQADLADATNRLASVLAENARLRNHPNEMELLKLRGEVTRLRPLQDDVVALQKKLAQSSGNLAEWKTNQLADAGQATPIDALQTYLYSCQKFDPAKIQASIVGDDADPPDPQALENFIKTANNHPTDGVSDYKILSQTWLGPDKVQVVLDATIGDSGMGVSVPFTLRNIDGEWKLVVFNYRDQNGTFNHIGFFNSSSIP